MSRQAKTTRRKVAHPYPEIGDYALIGDCHTAALISREASIDWCCMPRFDSASVFGRLLDWDRGGHCVIKPATDDFQSSRSYLQDTLVLATTFEAPGGEATLFDCFTARRGGARRPWRQLLRVVEGVRGTMDLEVLIRPRFDYGGVKPWLRRHGEGVMSAIAGDDAIVAAGDMDLEIVDRHDLVAAFTIHAGQRRRLSIVYYSPEDIDPDVPSQPDAEELDRRLEGTTKWWRSWSDKIRISGPYGPEARRSAVVLKALVHAPTGAVVAAPTTSLPESIGDERNWDYRYSWVRDSQFTVRSLTQLGCMGEADAFRRFIERSAGGSAESLQIMYGPGGERRLTEIELDLEGYRGSRPVRVGNAASQQMQLDVFGYLLDLAWRWHERGRSPDDDYWRFLLGLVDHAIEHWEEPDCGIWEMRGRPQHFVHSKVMCWAAVDRGIRLARECLRQAPFERWEKEAGRMRRRILRDGYDETRGVFVQAFESSELDASLLLLPAYDFIPYDDERMVRTTDAV
ncbi:MAG: glycoside hydrolase family 15 protein, partial [Actinomycetota bacterium]|nr:glycoside hydrolase family 15 protein [Actinomycetota bacterium]